MEANPVRIIQYFDGTKQSLIPLFQRPYTWNKDDWSVLWDDIMSQYSSDGSTHFMGAVVSFPVRTVPVGVSKHLIIDGQQRLTTMAILLAALRDSSIDNRAADRIHDYLVNRHYQGLDEFKLLPTQHDRKAYTNLVLKNVTSDDSGPIRNAHLFFMQKLKSSYDGSAIDPSRVLEVIEHNLQVVMINLGDLDDPYLIFESLNAKGQPLTEADLVRNYVLMKFKPSKEGGEQERVHRMYWKPLEDAVGENLTDFLRHYCMKSGSQVDKRAVYAAVKKLLSQSVDNQALEAELDSMTRLGRAYSRFLNPLKEEDSEVAARLNAFDELASTTCYPLLLRLFDSYDRSSISREDLTACLCLIESFVVRRAVCDVATNVLNRLFVQWCNDYRESGVVTWLRDKMASGKNTARWPSDDSFKEAFRTLPQYGGKATKFILTSLERNYAHKEPADLRSATIEHVMPQHLSPDWESALDTENGDTRALTHTFGNLTLSAYNSELGNDSFSKKRELLKGSHFELNHWISQQEYWSREIIEQRSAFLAEMAISIWPGAAAFA